MGTKCLIIVFLHFLRAVSQMNTKNKCNNLGNITFDASGQENNDAKHCSKFFFKTQAFPKVI